VPFDLYELSMRGNYQQSTPEILWF